MAEIYKPIYSLFYQEAICAHGREVAHFSSQYSQNTINHNAALLFISYTLTLTLISFLIYT